MKQKLLKNFKVLLCLKVAKVLVMLLFFSLMGQKGQAQSATSGGYRSEAPVSNTEKVTAPQAPVIILKADYDKLSPEKQLEVRTNPDKYTVKDPLAGKGQVSRAALKTMAPEKAKHILENPELYNIID